MNTDIHPIMTQVEDNLDVANFYYVREKDDCKSKIGVVFIGQKGDKYVRGVSILSMSEIGFDKADGIKHAARRMIRAAKKAVSSEAMSYGTGLADPEGRPPHPSVIKFSQVCDEGIMDDKFKSCYDAHLTEFEKKVLDKVG